MEKKGQINMKKFLYCLRSTEPINFNFCSSDYSDDSDDTTDYYLYDEEEKRIRRKIFAISDIECGQKGQDLVKSWDEVAAILSKINAKYGCPGTLVSMDDVKKQYLKAEKRRMRELEASVSVNNDLEKNEKRSQISGKASKVAADGFSDKEKPLKNPDKEPGYQETRTSTQTLKGKEKVINLDDIFMDEPEEDRRKSLRAGTWMQKQKQGGNRVIDQDKPLVHHPQEGASSSHSHQEPVISMQKQGGYRCFDLNRPMMDDAREGTSTSCSHQEPGISKQMKDDNRVLDLDKYLDL